MRLIKIIVLSLFFASALSACVKKGSSGYQDRPEPVVQNESISIKSSPSGAEARLSTGEVCTTPCTLERVNNQPFSVTIKKEGYKPETVEVTTNLAQLVEYNRKRGRSQEVLDQIRVNSLRLSPNPVNVKLKPIWKK